MPDGSTETTGTFAIGDVTGTKPTGAFRVVVDKDETRSVPILAYYRIAALFCAPAIETSGSQQIFDVDQADLDAAFVAARQDRDQFHIPTIRG